MSEENEHGGRTIEHTHRTQQAALQPIYIPTIDEIARSEKNYGILFVGSGRYSVRKTELRYLDFESCRIFSMLSLGGKNVIKALLSYQGEAYYSKKSSEEELGKVNSVYSLSQDDILWCPDEETKKQLGSLYESCLVEHRGSIIIGCSSRMYDITNEEILVDMPRGSDILDLASHEDDLFVLTKDNFRSSVWKTDKSSMEEVLLYGELNHQTANHGMILLPYGILRGKNDQDYPLSILSCVHGRYLDLNGEYVRKSEMHFNYITNIELLYHSDDIAEIICSGHKKGIWKMKIDLEDRRVVEKEPLLEYGKSLTISAMQPIGDICLHQKLIERGRDNEIKSQPFRTLESCSYFKQLSSIQPARRSDSPTTPARSNLLGIIYSVSDHFLKYLDMESKASYYLNQRKRGDGPLFSIFPHGEEVYFSRAHHKFSIHSLLTKMSPVIRESRPETMCFHKGKLLDAGEHGIMDTLRNKSLLPYEALFERKVGRIFFLQTDQDGNLFALVQNHSAKTAIHEVEDIDGKYVLQEEVFQFEDSGIFDRFHCIPYGNCMGKNGKEYDFTILRYKSLDSLYLNGDKIKHTEGLRRLQPFDLKGKILEAVYLTENVESFAKVKIDLDKKEIVDRISLEKRIPSSHEIQPVTDQTLHEKLLRKGQEVMRLMRG